MNLCRSIVKSRRSIWPLHSVLHNLYKLVCALFIIGCLGVSDTQWLRSLVRGLREAGHFRQISIDSHKFHFKSGYVLLLIGIEAQQETFLMAGKLSWISNSVYYTE